MYFSKPSIRIRIFPRGSGQPFLMRIWIRNTDFRISSSPAVEDPDPHKIFRTFFMCNYFCTVSQIRIEANFWILIISLFPNF